MYLLIFLQWLCPAQRNVFLRNPAVPWRTAEGADAPEFLLELKLTVEPTVSCPGAEEGKRRKNNFLPPQQTNTCTLGDTGARIPPQTILSNYPDYDILLLIIIYALLNSVC